MVVGLLGMPISLSLNLSFYCLHLKQGIPKLVATELGIPTL